VKAFLDKYWDYYFKLREFRKYPNSDVAKQLSAEFNRLFSTEINYPPLDERISKTKGKIPPIRDKKYISVNGILIIDSI